MTGFARIRRTVEQGELVLSLKSVNHRGLDLHFHMPPDMDSLEAAIRGVVKTGVARGHLQVHLLLAVQDRLAIVIAGAGGVDQVRRIGPLPEDFRNLLLEAEESRHRLRIGRGALALRLVVEDIAY